MGLIGKEKLIEQISIRLQRLNSAELRSVNAIVSRFLHNKNKRGPVAKNKFAAGPHLYSFSYRRQNFSPNCGKLFTFRACLRRLHRFGGA